MTQHPEVALVLSQELRRCNPLIYLLRDEYNAQPGAQKMIAIVKPYRDADDIQHVEENIVVLQHVGLSAEEIEEEVTKCKKLFADRITAIYDKVMGSHVA